METGTDKGVKHFHIGFACYTRYCESNYYHNCVAISDPNQVRPMSNSTIAELHCVDPKKGVSIPSKQGCLPNFLVISVCKGVAVLLDGAWPHLLSILSVWSLRLHGR